MVSFTHFLSSGLMVLCLLANIFIYPSDSEDVQI